MRQIKFRLWDKKYKKWIVRDSNIYLANEDREERPILAIGAVADAGVETCEFTGLKDIKGNEIFEGDIINDFGGLDGSDRYGIVEFDPKVGAFVVKEILSYGYVFTGGVHKLEVVGNIHENSKMASAIKKEDINP